jgi:hypothetical protein
MRKAPFVLFAASLMTAWTAEAAPPPKKPAAPAHWKPRTPPKPATSAAPATKPEDDAPYGTDEPAGSASASASAPAVPAAPPATTSGDAKLDEPPPPQTAEKEGPKPSPMNPEPPESPKGAPPPAPVSLDQLVSDIATLRARVAALTTSLFSSKLRIYAHVEGDDARIQSFIVTLDDGVVFRGDANFSAEDEKVLYEHAVAPGSHVIGIQVERQDARGAQFRTWQTTRFSIQVPERKVLEAIAVVSDDSDMAKDFPGDQDGKYDVEVRLRAKVADQ